MRFYIIYFLITGVFQSAVRVKQVKIGAMGCFSAFPWLFFSLLCTPDCSATRSAGTINCLIILVTPAHNEIFIPCLQRSLAEAVLLFLN